MTTKAVNRDDLLLNWKNAKDALETAKAVELALRQQVIDVEFSGHKEEGTETHNLGEGWKVKAVFKLNYTVDKETIDDALTAIEETGPEGKFIAGRLIKFKPELAVSEYRLLCDEHPEFKRIVDAALTIKPGTPSLELVPPKAK